MATAGVYLDGCGGTWDSWNCRRYGSSADWGDTMTIKERQPATWASTRFATSGHSSGQPLRTAHLAHSSGSSARQQVPFFASPSLMAFLSDNGVVLKVDDPPVLPVREVAPGSIAKSLQSQDRQWDAIKEAKRQGYSNTAPLVESESHERASGGRSGGGSGESGGEPQYSRKGAAPTDNSRPQGGCG